MTTDEKIKARLIALKVGLEEIITHANLQIAAQKAAITELENLLTPETINRDTSQTGIMKN
jgi:hypothetical protein